MSLFYKGGEFYFGFYGYFIIGVNISAALLLFSDKFATILKKMGISKTVHGYFLNDIADFKHGLFIRAYLQEDKTIYLGQLRKYEEREDTENTLIILSNYIKYDYDMNEKENYEDSSDCRVLLNIKNSSRMELFYNPSSPKID